MVCSVDQLASSAGVALLRAGGSAADAAIGTSAVLAVTTQHMCGMGGDLFALVHDGDGQPAALAAVGRAGSGADAAAMRAEGLTGMPMRGDVRSATVPGCVDGWLALHERFGRLPLDVVLAPARGYATDGFPGVTAAGQGDRAARRRCAGADDYLPARRAAGRRPGPPAAGGARPGGVVEHGRDGFYGGAFGAGLLAARRRTVHRRRPASGRWRTGSHRCVATAWGQQIWTVPPPSQGYLDAGRRPDRRRSRPARRSRPTRPGRTCCPRPRAGPATTGTTCCSTAPTVAPCSPTSGSTPGAASIDPRRRTAPPVPAAAGGTIHLCAVDAAGMGVSLIQSNAAGWGCHLVVPGTGIFLQNRGIGFSLEPGHPGELAPGRRPLHTLVPGAGHRRPPVWRPCSAPGRRHPAPGRPATAGPHAPQRRGARAGDRMRRDGLWARAGSAPGRAPGRRSRRWNRPRLQSWEPGLTARGHRVARSEPGTNVGHAHVIVVRDDGMLAGASDPRAITGAAIGW